MSDNLARVPAAIPALPVRHDERPPLAPVPDARTARRARPRLFYAGVAVGAIALVFLAKLLLSVAMSQGAYELSALQTENTTLHRQQQAATEDLARVSSPQYLAANAEALGMVTQGNPAFLRLSDHAVLGAPQTASVATRGAAAYVPNALLGSVPLVTDRTPDAATTPVAPASDAPVAEPTALPSPVTH